MKKLSFGWKLFLVFSYVQLIFAGGLLLLFLVRVFTYSSRYTGDDEVIWITLGGIMILVPFLNSTNIVYVMHRYFPNQAVPNSHRIFMTVIGILTAIVWIFLIIIYIIALDDYLTRMNEYPGYGRNRASFYFLLGFMADWVIGLYILIYQVKLASVIRKSSKQKIQDLIESIGKE